MTLSPRLARIGVDLFTALVAASVGIALAGLTWRLLGDPGNRYGVAPVAARVARPVDVGAVIAAAPFGSAAPVASAQPTDQPLILRGILLAVPRSASAALIQIGDAPPLALAIGQTAGAGVIDSIALDHVVLRVGDAEQFLGFPNRGGGSASGTPPPAPNSQSVVSSPVSGGALPGPAPTAPVASGFLSALGGAPLGDGYRLGSQPAPAAALAGLQAGDVIEHVDGTTAAEIMRDPAAYARAAADGSAQLDVVRGGRRLTLVVPLR